MRFLLDTHTAIWALGYKDKLSKNVKAIIDDLSIPLFVSIVSAWEIAIKVSIGKLNFTGGSVFFFEKMQSNGIEILTIKDTYIKQVEQLPFIHRDPFDRLIIACALSEDMTIITEDTNIHKYNIPWTW